LFNVMLLSDETQKVLRAMVEKQPWAALMFIAFILITGLCLLNTIIGVIVQKTVTVLLEYERNKLNDKRDQLEAVETLAAIMFRLDVNHNGKLSLEELTQGAVDKDFTKLLRQIDLPHGFTVQELYDMLDTEGDYSLDRGEFIAGMFRLIYSSDFQRQCGFQMEMVRMKRSLRGMQETMMKEIRDEHTELLVRIQDLISASPASKNNFRERKRGSSGDSSSSNCRSSRSSRTHGRRSSSGGSADEVRITSSCKSRHSENRAHGRSGSCGGDACSSDRRLRDLSVGGRNTMESNNVADNSFDDNIVDTCQETTEREIDDAPVCLHSELTSQVQGCNGELNLELLLGSSPRLWNIGPTANLQSVENDEPMMHTLNLGPLKLDGSLCCAPTDPRKLGSCKQSSRQRTKNNQQKMSL